MKSDATGTHPSAWIYRSWLPYLLLLGLYLTLRGYHSFDGDQAYRLPLLLHRQDPGLYAGDPFVRSFDQFNPHRGSLALLDGLSRVIGLPMSLIVVFVLTFLATARAITRLARAAWPEAGPEVGWIAVGLFFASKAGNIGTNHLFEAMVLDRLVALALGWQAIARVVLDSDDRWRAPLAIGLATVIHPSVGLQLAMTLGAAWIAWAVLGPLAQVRPSSALRAVIALGMAVTPGILINLGQRSSLQGDLPDRLFWILSVELQSPQHMLPHLWRMPQWLSWMSYLVLAALALVSAGSRRAPDRSAADENREAVLHRRRLAILLAIVVLGLGAAWFTIEIAHSIRATVFQPFRMSTVARGIALVLFSGRLAALWRRGDVVGRVRASILATGFLGEWLMVVATLVELSVSAADFIARRIGHPSVARIAPPIFGILMLVRGFDFLAHHDTESGHVPLLIAVGVGVFAAIGLPALRGFLAADEARRRRRFAVAMAAAWVVPGLAFSVPILVPRDTVAQNRMLRGLVDRCRFLPTPLDDIEKLAVWCREHTPESSRFIGPPGPKTFRLWSRRSLAFNRSGSPYHGDGLSDWFARFRDHVDYRGTPEDFVRAYREHRHEFEGRYDALTESQRAALAVRQGADYVIARAPSNDRPTERAGFAPMELLHVEGRYAAYRVNPAAVVQRQP